MSFSLSSFMPSSCLQNTHFINANVNMLCLVWNIIQNLLLLLYKKYSICLSFPLATKCNMFLLSKHIFSNFKYATLIFMQTIFNTFPLQNSLTPFPYDYFYGEIHNTKKNSPKIINNKT